MRACLLDALPPCARRARCATRRVYPRFLRLAAEQSDPVARMQWVVTYFVAGEQQRAQQQGFGSSNREAEWTGACELDTG